MVFSSPIFFFYFLPLALAVYYALPRRGRNLALAVLSYGFYGWANPLFVVLLLTTTTVDFVSGLVIARNGLRGGGRPLAPLAPGTPRSRLQKGMLAFSVCTDLSILGFFKYFNFVSENIDALAAWLGIPGVQVHAFLRVTLPLGISFYTFQSLSYTIDVYRGHTTALRSFIHYACYVSMFPQLVAGPIIRFREVAAQMAERTLTAEKFARGVAFFSLGMAKKVLVANACGKIADVAFDAGSVGVLEAWYGLVAYAFQIYFDFSAYSDMAIGLGLMLGFVFPKNFDSPYKSRSITEFWRRWHMSLSTWLRDYLYVSLGGNRRGRGRTYVNLAVTMLLGGLWHGASWNFVLWGSIHGAFLVFERALGKDAVYRRLPAAFRTALTFLIVTLAWVFFRAPDLPAAVHYFACLFGLAEVQEGGRLLPGIVYQPYYLGSFVLAGVVAWACPQTWDWTRVLTWPKAFAAVSLLLASLALLLTQAYNPFIYFIF